MGTSSTAPSQPSITAVSFADDPLQALARNLAREQRDTLPNLSHIHVILGDSAAAPRLRKLLLQEVAAWEHSALLGPRISSLSQWAADIALDVRPILSDTRRELLLVAALREHRGLFGDANLWSLADSLLALFDELTLNDVSLPTKLDEFVTRISHGYGINGRIPKALTIEAQLVHRLWHAWQQQLHGRGELDRNGAYLLRLARDSQYPSNPNTTLYLAGFSQLSKAETRWLQIRMERGDARLFLQGEQHAARPLGIGADDTPWPQRDDPLGIFLEQAFSPRQQPLALRASQVRRRLPDSPVSGRIHVLSTDGAEQEASAVDLQVRRLLNEGCETVAVVTENRRLARRVRALLERAGIELQDSAGWALSTTSAAAVVERWLECVEEDFPYQALLDLLKSPFVVADERRTEHLARVYRLEQDVIRHENVGRGLAAYQRHLRFRQRRLPAELGRNLEAVAALLDHLDAAARLLRPYLAGGEHSAAAALNALRRSLEALGSYPLLQADAAGARIIQELEGMAAAVSGDPLSMSWGELRTWLGRTLERYNFQPPGNGCPVTLSGLSHVTLGRFDAVIIAGCERDYLPGNETTSPFFNDAVRADLGLASSEQRRGVVFQRFRAVLESAPRVLLTLRREQDGEPILPSPWVETLCAFHRQTYGTDLNETTLAALLEQHLTQVVRHTPAPIPASRPSAIVSYQQLPRELSASAYQQLVNCPYQFYAARCLKLAPPEEIREALEKADYGERVHRCLEAFHQARPPLPGPFAGELTPARREEAIALLQQIASDVFAQDLEDNFLHRGWLQRWQAIIPSYVDWQTAREDAQWKVLAVEQQRRRDGVVAEHSLHGRIDRIDRGHPGLAVVDYKTGNYANEDEVLSGESVQLPFYVLLARETDTPVAQVEYLVLDKGRCQSRTVLTGAELAELSDAVGERLQLLLRDLANGHGMPAWGDEITCGYCPLDGICRRDAWGNDVDDRK